MRSREILQIFYGLCMSVLPFFMANLLGNLVCVIGWALMLLGILQLPADIPFLKRAKCSSAVALFFETLLLIMLLADKTMNILYLLIGLITFTLALYTVCHILSALHWMAQQQDIPSLASRLKKSRIFALLSPAAIALGYVFSGFLPSMLPYLLPAVFFLYVASAVLLAYRYLDANFVYTAKQ